MKAEYAKQLPDGWERFSRFFFALGDRTRQQILLVFDPKEEICVNDIARLFSLSRPAISHHLKVLRDAGLLLCEKRGKEVYYRVNYGYSADVMRVVQDFIMARATGSAAGNGAVSSTRLPAQVSGLVSWDRAPAPLPAARMKTHKSDD
jgi:ArsR family transcriptional regulator, arsenate/arsenite/antimonite-responsive transcriptional repressor